MKKRHTPEQIVRKLREADAELAAQRSGLPDAFGVRGVVRVGRRRCGVGEGATIGNGTLIRAGTNNGDRSCRVSHLYSPRGFLRVCPHPSHPARRYLIAASYPERGTQEVIIYAYVLEV